MLVGYELLFRDGMNNHAVISDQDQATAQVVINALLETGLDNLVGTHRAYINFTRNLLLDDSARVLPPDQTIIELLETIEPDEHIVRAVEGLVKRGYTVALDDFVNEDKYRPLLPLVQIIKIDVLALGLEKALAQAYALAPLRKKLLAEKVEDRSQFVRCKDAGFDFFQGYFFSKPEIVVGTKPPESRLLLLQLLARVNDPDIEFGRLEELIVQDVSLSFRLMKILNAASYGLAKPVTSIKQVLNLIGMNRVRNWVSLLLLSDIDDKPPELFKNTMIRARSCHNLATRLSGANADACFTAGLFSSLDALFDQPLAVLLDPLPLSPVVKSALLAREGVTGKILTCVVAQEQCDWEHVHLPGVTDQEINDSYIEAIHWAQELLGATGI